VGPDLNDLTGLVAVVMVFSIVLIPIIGATARFAFKPIAESLVRLMAVRSDEETIHLLERRVALLEQQIDALESGITEVRQAERFDRELAGQARKPLGSPGPPGTEGA
jgi:hypothetical protein